MTDFLLELLCEEIPARMQSAARNALAQMLARELEAVGIAAEAIDVWSTPRRLALVARGLPLRTEASREEVKGPRVGAPPQALEGFLRKTGLSEEQLEERGGVWFATKETPGRPMAELLGEAVERIVRDFPWPKSMRWGAASESTASLRWVRPLHGIVAMLGEEIVPVTIDGIQSGATTAGHRFHHPGPITVGGAQDYAEKLRACHVIVDQDEREKLIREGAEKAAKDAGLTLVPDEGLVVENAGLTEWPVPLLGRFDPDYLDVPREVIVLTMRTNQKYFACTDEAGALAPAFVCVANVDAKDGGEAIVEGNRRVLAARLADARFFWEQDLKVPLEEQAAKLSGIVFHEKLGTVADKVERVAKLARWLVEEGIVGTLSPAGRGQGEGAPPSRKTSTVEPPHPNPLPAGEREELADFAERAARLCKADLVTGMVGEFPELQGIVGGYLARAQGEPDAIADSIRDHYKPAGQGDEVPTAPVTVAVALADKLDTICSFFGIGELPTGSKDPFALRRSALGVIAVIRGNKVKLHLAEAARQGWQAADRTVGEVVADFFGDRLEVALRGEGIRHDLVRASVSWGNSTDGRVDRIEARARALQSFVDGKDGADLLTAYKRAANILKKEDWTGPEILSSPEEQGIPQTGEEDPLVLVEEPGLAEAVAELASGSAGASQPEEQALIDALDAAEPKARAAVEAEDFTGAMAALAQLRGPIDAFFDNVTVNDPDPATRERRLNLLLRFRDAVHTVADFSRIEG